jgi:lipopolysaccharide/colanic/teichoic acid biosynthesis glycosyltransferase
MNTTELTRPRPLPTEQPFRGRSSDTNARHEFGAAALRPRHRWYGPIKFVAEYLAAIVLFVLAFPILCVAAVMIKLSSRGPVFYLQTRLGLTGREYRVIKLRTMVHNAEALTGPVWAGTNDSRITPVGRFLRDTHIDEFPQLINVLLGQMSLIGPRPERPEIVQDIEWKIANYRDRLRVRPGITGLAQMNLPPDSDLESVCRKLRHDLYYIRCRSPWLDLKIFCATSWLLIKTLVRGVWRIFALPNVEKVDNQIQCIVEQDSDLVAASAAKPD